MKSCCGRGSSGWRIVGPSAAKALGARRPLEQAPVRISPLRREIGRGISGDTAGSELSRYIAFAVREIDRAEISTARRLLLSMERKCASILTDARAAYGVVHLAGRRRDWIRDAFAWEPCGTTPREQLRELAGFAFQRYAIPGWLDEAWVRTGEAHLPLREWFIHLGAGRHFADAPGLPYPLTRRAAHFAVNAPAGLRAGQALRWGQLRGLGVPVELCDETVHTRLSTRQADEPFWKTFGQWLAANPEVIGNVAQIVDYLCARRAGPFRRDGAAGVTITGRSPDALMRDIRAWHRELNRRQRVARNKVWPSCGIIGFEPTTETGRPADLVITELTASAALECEGESLEHCVASYAQNCATGRGAIFSLRRRETEGGELVSRITIEVIPEFRQIVQARGRHNSRPSDVDQDAITFWARNAGLSILPHVFK